MTRPNTLYRYSKIVHLERSLHLGEFRLDPASYITAIEEDEERQDDELVRTRIVDPNQLILTQQESGKRINPIGPVTFTRKIGSDYFMLCFSSEWDQSHFSRFKGSDACLVLHDIEQFAEKLHTCVSKVLPEWVGMDSMIHYNNSHPLGVAFSKPERYTPQKEFRFAWLPTTPIAKLEHQRIFLGDISNIAEIRMRS